MILMKLADVTATAVVLLGLLVSVIWTAGLCYGMIKVIAAVI